MKTLYALKTAAAAALVIALSYGGGSGFESLALAAGAVAAGAVARYAFKAVTY